MRGSSLNASTTSKRTTRYSSSSLDATPTDVGLRPMSVRSNEREWLRLSHQRNIFEEKKTTTTTLSPEMFAHSMLYRRQVTPRRSAFQFGHRHMPEHMFQSDNFFHHEHGFSHCCMQQSSHRHPCPQGSLSAAIMLVIGLKSTRTPPGLVL